MTLRHIDELLPEYHELCGSTPRTGASAIAWQRADLPPGTIDGRIIDVQTRAVVMAPDLMILDGCG